MFFKFLSSCLLACLALSPVMISADHHHHHDKHHDKHHDHKCGHIHRHDVAGTYQLSGFSNSLPIAGTPLEPQSQAVVGQATFKEDGSGLINFIDFVASVGGNLVPIHQENVPFTYQLNSENGEGTAQLNNFPATGINSTFRLSFKSKNCKVVGFSMLTVERNVPTGLWTLIQGVRFD